MEFIHEESSKVKYLNLFNDTLGIQFPHTSNIFIMSREDLSIRNRPIVLINNHGLFYFTNISTPPKKYYLSQVIDVQVYEKETRVFMRLGIESFFYVLVFLNRDKAKEIFRMVKSYETKREEAKVAILVHFGALKFVINVPDTFDLESLKKRCIYRIGKYFCPDKVFSESIIDLNEYNEYRFTVMVENTEILLESDSDFKSAKMFCDNKLKVIVTLDERKQYKEYWREEDC
ncbi:hypothetical protein H312_01745 [Anncaliia algerae PRA339]|uniref:Uncharacterized protein n=1 Tax=Anncaliia algerae PRA339 TaxID=1288291 RepID=A0A059F178_9MICR|nr:hypothetical protein H312_01745 [Anncaliia algerae PRA339]